MDPNQSSVEDDAPLWEEAVTASDAVQSQSKAAQREADQHHSSQVPPGVLSAAGAVPTPAEEPSKHVSWAPGMFFQKIKAKVEENEMLKKIKSKVEENEVVKKIKSKVEENDAVKKLTESSAAAKIFGPLPVSPTPKAATNPGTHSPPQQGLFASGNHPIYNKAMDWKNKNRDESQKRTLDSHRKYSESEAPMLHNAFASIAVSEVVLEGLPQWAKRSPYVVFTMEGNRQATTRAPSKGPYSWPQWQGAWDVSDVWSDLSISVFAAKAGSEVMAMEDDYVSKGFLPLSSVLTQSKNQPLFRTLFRSEGDVFKLRVDVHLLPLSVQTRTYARCVHGMPTTGLSRPTEPTGRVRLTITIKMKVPLIKALALSAPMRRSVLPVKDEALNPALMQQRKMRLKTVISHYSSAFELLVEGILSWKHPFATWVWLTIFTQVTLFSEPYNLPFMTALTAVLGAYFVHIQKRAMGASASPILFADETSLDPELPQTIPAKVRALQKLATGFQILLGMAATVLERIYFALSWDDPMLSFLVSAALLGLGFVASIVCAVLYEYAIVFRTLLFAAGLSLLVPGAYQQMARDKINAALKRLRSSSSEEEDDDAITTAIPAPTGGLRRELSVEEMLSEHDDADAHGIVDASLAHAMPSREDLRGALANIFARIPDGIEIDHRAIARARCQSVVVNDS